MIFKQEIYKILEIDISDTLFVIKGNNTILLYK